MNCFWKTVFSIIVLMWAGQVIAAPNKFQDRGLQTIYDLQNQRDSEGLQVYLTDNNPIYRQAAAMAFASVQTPATIQPLATLLEDKEEMVRRATAYALGQIRDPQAEPLLIKAFDQEISATVRGAILEALGKCGTEKGLVFLTGLPGGKPEEDATVLAGQMWGLYRFGLRHMSSPQGIALAVTRLTATTPEPVRLAASSFLARIRQIDLKEYATPLLTALDQETNVYTLMNLTLAMGKATTPAVMTQLLKLLDKKGDSRVKINALRALAAFEYDNVKETFIRMTSHQDVNIAIIASEYFLDKGQPRDGLLYFETAKKINHWRSRANMLAAALEFVPETDTKNRKRINDWLDAAYKKSANTYEKAWLLTAMGWDLQNYMLVKLCTFNNTLEKTGRTVLSTYGMEALANMFNRAKKAKKMEEKVRNDFLLIFQRAIQSRDSALIAIAAGVLRDPEMELKNAYPDTTFLTTALHDCQLPQDQEVWQELKKTIAYLEGKTETPTPTITKNQPINWELLKTIPADKRVRIKTTRGDILIRLRVNESPGAVANFLQLIRQGFYKNSAFHRVVPNFVIQDGCPRGDGWGGPPDNIGSELAPLHFEEGSVGMASSGKDTEGSQWFITLSPTPHLDGQYSNFAIVEFGFDVIPRIEVGDRVLSFEEI